MPACGRDRLDGRGEAGADVGELGRDLRASRCRCRRSWSRVPMPTPRTRASSYSRQRAEVDVVGAVLQQDQPRRVLAPGPAAAISSPRLRACCGGSGHWPSRLVLSAALATAPLMASWSPVSWQLVGRTVMVSPRSARHQARVGQRRGALRDAAVGQARSAASGRGWPARARTGPSRRGRRPGSTAGTGWGRRRATAGRQHDAPGDQAPATTTAATPDTRGSGAPRRPRFAAFPSTDLTESLPGRQRRGDLTGWAQPGGSRTRQPLWPPKPNEFDSTAAGSHGSARRARSGS